MSALAGDFIKVRTEAELGETLRACVAAGVGIIPTGGEERLPPAPGDENRATVSLAPMDAIIEHEIEDLTLTCQAGCRLAAIDDIVHGSAQRVAFEVARPEERTVGGIVAARSEGFIRSAFGPVREQILGMKVMLSSGEIASTGGRVVKNVTGYDLAKLYTGSMGAFGIITELTIRLRPQPESTTTLVIPRRDHAEAFELAMALRDLTVPVTALAMAGQAAVVAALGPWLVAVRLEGGEAARAQARASVRESASRASDIEELEDPEDQRVFWRDVSGFAATQGFATRIDLPLGHAKECIDRLIRAAETDAFGLVADLATGRLEFTLPEVFRDVDTTCGQLVLSRLSRDFGASVAIPGDPADIQERSNRFGGPSPGVAALTRRLKRAFDPSGLMGEGRLLV